MIGRIMSLSLARLGGSGARLTICASRVILAGFLVAASGCDPDRARHHDDAERVVVAIEWDTLFEAGSRNVNDTLFARPRFIELWGERIAVADEIRVQLLAFTRSGEFLWALGRKGSGPREFLGFSDIEVAPNGNLWVLDPGNVRISEISPDGEFVRLIPLQHLSWPAYQIVALGERVVAENPASIDHALMELDAESFELRSTSSLPWVEPLSRDMHLALSFATHPSRPGWWAAAFLWGPGFMIWQGDEARAFRYIDEIPYSLKATPPVRAAGADSARYGARALIAAGQELFMFSGGRPRRSVHDGEPSRWVDVYSWNGEYRRSYRLPYEPNSLTTDGETFYLLKSDPYPTLIALRPRVQDPPRARAGATVP